MPKANQFDRRSGLSVVELLVVCTILGLLCALILPGVENARELMRHPKPLPSWEQRVARLGLWGFLVIPLATAGGALLFGICVRLLLPPAYRKHLPWVTPPRTQFNVPTGRGVGGKLGCPSKTYQSRMKDCVTWKLSRQKSIGSRSRARTFRKKRSNDGKNADFGTRCCDGSPSSNSVSEVANAGLDPFSSPHETESGNASGRS